MGLKISQFRTDPKASVEGIWIPIGEGAKIRVARLNNAKYEEFIQTKMAPYAKDVRARALRGEDITGITDTVAEAAVREGVARFILLDWEGVTDDAGNAIPYTPELGMQYFADAEYRDLYKMVLEFAVNRALFSVQAREDATKN